MELSGEAEGYLMRVLVIQPTVPHYRVEFFRSLSQNIRDFFIYASNSITGNPNSVEESELYPARCNLKAPVREFFNTRVLWQYLPDLSMMKRGDVIVLSGNPRFIQNYAIIIQARCRGVGIVWWGHGFSSTSTKIGTTIRKRIMRLADTILLYTDEDVQLFKIMKFDPFRLFYTNNSVPSNEISKIKSQLNVNDIDQFKLQNGINNKKIFIFVGRLTKKSMPDVLINSFLKVYNQHHDVELIIIGDGDLLPGAKKLVNNLELDKAVRFIGPLYEEKELAKWFLSACAFVYPGDVGLSLLHAMNYGCPPIVHSNRKRHNPEIAALVPDHNGLVFKVDDTTDLAACMLRILENPELASKLSENALETVTSRFNTDKMVQGFLAACRAASRRALERR